MRTPCSPKTGCHRCGKPLPPRRRAYCSDKCCEEHCYNHLWNAARYEAMLRAQGGSWRNPPRCEECGYVAEFGDRRRKPMQVHHKIPVPTGQYHGWSCLHHQENLIVLCITCHTAAHKALRSAS